MMFTRSLLFAFAVFVAPLAHAIDLDRAMILLPPSGTATEDATILTWQKRAAAPTATIADFERLGWAFVAKARRTLDAGEYKLAEKTADVMDTQFGPSAEAALLRGHVFHNLHRFHNAEQIARRLITDRGLPEDWALLSDALMEQGRLAESVDALQHMANLKPGAEADTRIAHLRWLKGDADGAIAAMIDALRTTSAGDRTSLAWMLTQLSGFYLQAGNIERAAALAKAAAAQLPAYPPALLAEGRAELARQATPAAVALFAQAEKLNPLPEYQWWLAEARRAAGDEAGARAIEGELKARAEATDPRTFSLFLATHREDAAMAVRLARAELDTRRDVLTHDALAWALFARGDVQAALTELRAALAEGTKDPRLLLHAVLIERANGRVAEARQFAAQCRPAVAALLPSERKLLADVSLALETVALPRANTVAAATSGSPISPSR